MRFKSDSPDFALGFQCGQIWERLNHCDVIEGLYIHADAKDQIESICKRFHAKYKIEPAGEGWFLLDAKIDVSLAN